MIYNIRMTLLTTWVGFLALSSMRTADCKAFGSEAGIPRDPDLANSADLLTTAHYLDVREQLGHLDDKICETDKHLTRDLTEISGKFSLLEEKMENLQLKMRLELRDQLSSFLNELKELGSVNENVRKTPSPNVDSRTLGETPACVEGRHENTSKIDKVDGALVALQSATARLDDKLYALTEKTDVCVRTVIETRQDNCTEDETVSLQGATASAWITVLRRVDGRVNFTRGWDDYKAGFGDLEREFWLGLEDIHQLTAVQTYRLRVVLTDFSGEVKFAEYSQFYVRGEADNYRLHVDGYVTGSTAGDSLDYHNGMGFTTIDKDNDKNGGNCARMFFGGWWYNSCHHVNPTGLYLAQGSTDTKGINWSKAYDDRRSFKRLEMSIRRAV